MITDSSDSLPSKDQTVTPIDVEVKSDGEVLLQPKSADDEGYFAEDEIVPESDLSNLDRRIWVVTTAALPWRTGTAVNPLCRALYLTRGRQKHYVTLLVPWLEDVTARKKLYGADNTFEEGGQDAQEEWIREYCRTRANCVDEEKNLRIMFWKGVYHDSFGSIFPIEDICSLIPKNEADIAILEEPEHLNWWRVPQAPNTDEADVDTLGWAHKFNHVVGILHTNYGSYVKQYGMGTSLITAPALNGLSSLVVRAYCKKVIRLSGTLTSLDASKEVTCNVHGVRPEFLDPAEGEADAEEEEIAPIYFIGKLIWAKGFDQVLEVQERFRDATGEYFKMDVYGGGNDNKAIQRAFFGRQKMAPQESNSMSETNSGSNSESEDDKKAASVFKTESSLRDQLCGDAEAQVHSEIGSDFAPSNGGSSAPTKPGEPMDIIGAISQKTVTTGVGTADAAINLIETVMETGMKALGGDGKKKSNNKSQPFSLVPQRARYKWRRSPLPARFLGVKDHIEIRDVPEHKIFLNMSTSEVLCTTTAEALAMGKYVVIPKHPSNDFFLQFPNCLAYDLNDLDDCVAKLQYALSNNPEPLSKQQIYMLSWEGATERLFKASVITMREAAERKASGKDEEDMKAAKFHVDTARRSQYFSKLFTFKSNSKSD